MTELLLAIEEGKPPTNINELVAKCEGMGITDPSKFEEAGKLTPLQQAVHDKNVTAVFQLLEAERFNESEWNGMHYVRYEASDDNSDRLFILALLLKEDGRGGTQSISMMPNSTGTSAFVLACQANDRSAVDLMLLHRREVDANANRQGDLDRSRELGRKRSNDAGDKGRGVWLFPINEYSHRVYLLTEFFERRRGEWDQKKPVSVTVCDTIEEALLIGSAPLPLLVGYSNPWNSRPTETVLYSSEYIVTRVVMRYAVVGESTDASITAAKSYLPGHHQRDTCGRSWIGSRISCATSNQRRNDCRSTARRRRTESSGTDRQWLTISLMRTICPTSSEVPDEDVVNEAVNKAMAEKYPKIDFATVDFELMAQQRKQFDADIRAAYKSPLREAYEAAMTAVAAVAAAMSAPPEKTKAQKE